jgi:hypothetical protein
VRLRRTVALAKKNLWGLRKAMEKKKEGREGGKDGREEGGLRNAKEEPFA